MTIKSRIIADSIAGHGVRLTTMELYYPRIIHSELMTHGMFSRNASSSRAIPVSKIIQAVLDDPGMPVHWGLNQPGMQSKPENVESVMIRDPNWLVPDDVYEFKAKDEWLKARDAAVEAARGFVEAGYHKQIVNRLLEPFSHMTVTITATDWVNFLILRRDKDADPTMRELAESIYRTFKDSAPPRELLPGEWHLPYVRDIEDPGYFMSNGGPGLEGVPPAAKMSAARCARNSYNNHDGTSPDPLKDLALFDKLLGGKIKHASPAEHPAMAMPDDCGLMRYGKLRGFRPLRSLIDGENLDLDYYTVDDYILEQERQA